MNLSTFPRIPLLDVDAAAEYLGVSPRWVRRAISERRVDHVKLGHLVRLHVSDLDALIERSKREAING